MPIYFETILADSLITFFKKISGANAVKCRRVSGVDKEERVFLQLPRQLLLTLHSLTLNWFLLLFLLFKGAN